MFPLSSLATHPQSTTSPSTPSPSTPSPPGAPCKAFKPTSYGNLDAVATTLFRDGDNDGDKTPPPSPPYDGLLSPCAMNPRLSHQDRDYKSPESSPQGSPVCPDAPRASRFSGMSFGKAVAALEHSDVARELF
jgi:hypothetical protein